MDVYARNRNDGFVSCITMAECEAEPWRWEFVQVAPGQGVEDETAKPEVEEVEVKGQVVVEVEKVGTKTKRTYTKK